MPVRHDPFARRECLRSGEDRDAVPGTHLFTVIRRVGGKTTVYWVGWGNGHAGAGGMYVWTRWRWVTLALGECAGMVGP